MNDTAAHPYTTLTPQTVIDAVEACGLPCDGRQLALNSYENRVYMLMLEDGSGVVAKFYRPQRWSEAQLLEEHDFALELAARDIPVVAPLTLLGRTLHCHAGFHFALYPRRGGRAPELEDRDTLQWIGRFMGRLHAVGATRAFAARPALDVITFGIEPRDWLLAHDAIPPALAGSWSRACELALDGIRQCYARAGDVPVLRLHGDCHPGNILWTGDGPHFVDLDDARSGPAVQDLWMLLGAGHDTMQARLYDVLTGYEAFMRFDRRELHLLEALRTLRLIHYSAWLARRWSDPAFPAAFPWFGSERYWQERIEELHEQIELMQEQPLL